MHKQLLAVGLSVAFSLSFSGCSKPETGAFIEADAKTIEDTAVSRPPDKQRADINRALVGRWRGTVVSSRYPEAGSQVGTPFTLTFAVTSDDGLDAAYWGDDVGLTLITYIDPGTRMMRTWTPQGVLTESAPAVTNVVGPGMDLSWSFDRSTNQTLEDGSAIELRTTFSFQNRTLSATSKQRAAGSTDAFIENQTIAFVRYPL